MGSLSLLQHIFPTQKSNQGLLHCRQIIYQLERKGKESEVTQSCPTLCDPMDCSLPGSSVHGVFQAIVLERIAISFSSRSSWPWDGTLVSRIVDRCFTIWATREVQLSNQESPDKKITLEDRLSLNLNQVFDFIVIKLLLFLDITILLFSALRTTKIFLFP